MKTAQAIQYEIEDLRSKYSKPGDFKTSEVNKARKRLELLQKCIYYLNTNPNAEFVKAQLEESTRRLKLIDTGFSAWISSTPQMAGIDPKKARAKYNNEMERKKTVSHISTLKYLLT